MAKASRNCVSVGITFPISFFSSAAVLILAADTGDALFANRRSTDPLRVDAATTSRIPQLISILHASEVSAGVNFAASGKRSGRNRFRFRTFNVSVAFLVSGGYEFHF